MSYRRNRASHPPADSTSAASSTRCEKESTTRHHPEIVQSFPRVVQECTRHLLHESPVGRVEICTGGTVSLVLGGLTLRMPIHGLVELQGLLHDALHRLAVAEHSARTTAPHHEEN